MKISAEAFRELEQIVGSGNVGDDPSTCMSYAWNAGIGGLPQASRLSPIVPIAVVLPDSTEQVQQIVKTCLRHRIGFKPHSTGYGSFAAVGSPNAISMDLRRMNKIHALDGRNQMAVIDPYVTAGQLQAEAMKVGLTCHIVGAGPTHSPLASATSMFGVGISGSSTGNNVRNLLGVEWVSPEGDIVRIGSPGSGCGWFTDEGPGPGFRGMLRGVIGALGELGVFTRIGYKLYPWRGPSELERTGHHPQVGIELPQHFALYHLVWDNWEDLTAATYALNRSGVAEILVRVPPNSWALTLTETNNDFCELIASRDIPAMAKDEDGYRSSWTLLAAASSASEATYKRRVISNILQKTRGRAIQLTPQQTNIAANLLVTSLFIPRVMRPSAAIGTSFGVLDSFRRLPDVMKAGEKCFGEDIRPGGGMMQTAREEFWNWPSERRHMWAENAYAYNINVDKSRGSVFRYALEHANMVDSRGDLGLDAFAGNGPLTDFFAPARNGANVWMRRIKNLFDSRGVQDALMYVSRRPPAVARCWPWIRPILFARVFRRVFKRITNHLAVVGLRRLLGKQR